MEALESQGKNKIINVLIIGVSFFAGAYLYNGQHKQIAVAQERMSVEENKNQVLRQLESVQQEVDVVKRELVKKEPGVVMSTVSGIAQECGIKMASFRPGGAEQRRQDYVRSVYALEINAPSYNALGIFISKLEASRDLYIMDQVSIRPVLSVAGQTDSLNVAITLATVSANN